MRDGGRHVEQPCLRVESEPREERGATLVLRMVVRDQRSNSERRPGVRDRRRGHLVGEAETLAIAVDGEREQGARIGIGRDPRKADDARDAGGLSVKGGEQGVPRGDRSGRPRRVEPLEPRLVSRVVGRDSVRVRVPRLEEHEPFRFYQFSSP